jgi:hypothetical protein
MVDEGKNLERVFQSTIIGAKHISYEKVIAKTIRVKFWH